MTRPSSLTCPAVERAYDALKRSDWVRLAACAAEVLSLSHLVKDREMEGLAFRFFGIATRETNSVGTESEDHFRRASELLEGSADASLRADVENELAGQLAARGDVDGARAHIDSAETILAAHGNYEDARVYECSRAWADLIEGKYSAAMDRAEKARTAALAAMNEKKCETWALQTGALAAVYAGEVERGLDWARALLSLTQLGGPFADLVEAHLILCRARARAGDASAIDDFRGYVDSARSISPVLHATARVLVADAMLTDHPTLQAFAERDEVEQYRSLVGGWLVAEFKHLDARWAGMPIRRVGDVLVVRLTEPDCLPSERLILDYARLRAAEARNERTKIKAAPDLCMSLRSYYKLRDAMRARLGGDARASRHRRTSG